MHRVTLQKYDIIHNENSKIRKNTASIHAHLRGLECNLTVAHSIKILVSIKKFNSNMINTSINQAVTRLAETVTKQ